MRVVYGASFAGRCGGSCKVSYVIEQITEATRGEARVVLYALGDIRALEPTQCRARTHAHTQTARKRGRENREKVDARAKDGASS